MTKLILPEPPPVLSAEEMEKMTPEALKAEEDHRYALHKQVDEIQQGFLQAWLLVYRHRQKQAEKAAIRAEVLAEMKAGAKELPPITDPTML